MDEFSQINYDWWRVLPEFGDDGLELRSAFSRQIIIEYFALVWAVARQFAGASERDEGLVRSLAWEPTVNRGE